MSEERIRTELSKAQVIVTGRDKEEERYALPTKITPDGNRIYKTMNMKYCARNFVVD